MVAVNDQRPVFDRFPDFYETTGELAERHMQVKDPFGQGNRGVGSLVILPDVQDGQSLSLVEASLEIQNVHLRDAFRHADYSLGM
mgnify:CR=1 FL=1